MSENINGVPLAPIARIIKNAGAKRVSDAATVALAKYLDLNGQEIAKRAIKLSKHAHRKTVKAVDIELANSKKI